MERRNFIKVLAASAAALSFAARAQRPPTPIGFLRPTRAEESGYLVAAVRQGLRESGYPSDKVVIEARWGDGREDKLPKFAAELAALPVAAIVAGSLPSAVAAKKATSSVPIVFVTGADPQAEGLVANLNHPGGNMTGVSFYDNPIIGKRLELLRELVPNAETIYVLQDPNMANEDREIEAAVRARRQKVVIVKAGTEQDINAAFSSMAKSNARAVLVGGGPFFNGRRNQLIGLAALHAIPASYTAAGGVVAAGGLISYGASQTDAYRRAGVYVARILTGEKPGNMPVELPTRFELAINMKTAKALDLTVPKDLLLRADEVIQ